LIIIEDPVRKIGCALLERIERPLGWDISVVEATKINFSFKIKILELLEAVIYSRNPRSYCLDCR